MNHDTHFHHMNEQVVSSQLGNIPIGADVTVGHAIIHLAASIQSFGTQMTQMSYMWGLYVAEEPVPTISGPVDGDIMLSWGIIGCTLSDSLPLPFEENTRIHVGSANHHEVTRGQRRLGSAANRVWFTTRRSTSLTQNLDVGNFVEWTVRLLVFTQ